MSLRKRTFIGLSEMTCSKESLEKDLKRNFFENQIDTINKIRFAAPAEF
jgi:hypothetical protein